MDPCIQASAAEAFSPRAEGAFAGCDRERNPAVFACERFHKRVKFKAVASDPKDTRKRAETLLKQGAFGSGPAAQFMGLGLQFVLSLLLFLYLGTWVDGQLGTSPLFLILGVFIGAGAAFYSMYRKLKAAERDEEEQERLEREEK